MFFNTFMTFNSNEITTALKTARTEQRLKQSTLAGKSGVQQRQISLIENGKIDPRLSSLITLSRALDLELMLVPRKAVPAVKSVIRATTPGVGKPEADQQPAYQLDDETDNA